MQVLYLYYIGLDSNVDQIHVAMSFYRINLGYVNFAFFIYSESMDIIGHLSS